MGTWRNGSRDRLKICSRKGCWFNSSRAYHFFAIQHEGKRNPLEHKYAEVVLKRIKYNPRIAIPIKSLTQHITCVKI
jgi:hypothetical protein